MKAWRLEEDPVLRALTGTAIAGFGKGPRVIVWIVSAGEYLDERAHREIWKRGSAAEQCEFRGDTHYWERGGQPQGR
jgi:hypothetical protein